MVVSLSPSEMCRAHEFLIKLAINEHWQRFYIGADEIPLPRIKQIQHQYTSTCINHYQTVIKYNHHKAKAAGR